MPNDSLIMDHSMNTGTKENDAALPPGVDGTPRLLITKMVRTSCCMFDSSMYIEIIQLIKRI